MQENSRQMTIDMQHIKTMLHPIFPSPPKRIERVAEGISTYVYRITYKNETFYLRILPEAEASFAPEVVALAQLRRMQIKVPEVIYFAHCDENVQRSVMVMTEIKGHPVSRSTTSSEEELQAILMQAGRELASINSIAVNGFGWVKRDREDMQQLQAEWPTHRAFALEYWETDVAYLAGQVLQTSEIAGLERIRAHYNSWLEVEQAHLAHGDFDTTHIYQENGQYTGIIDFGEIRGTDRWYDAGHFHMRDGEELSLSLESALLGGYQEIIALPSDYRQRIRFASLLINVRTLARSLQKRPFNRYTQHQLQILREDLITLQ